MTPDDARRSAVLSAPDKTGKFPLFPATFGLLEWLQSKRKNPLICGGKAELKHALEMCLSFTMPSAELCKIPAAKIDAMAEEFAHVLTPQEFQRIQKHAESELLKFQMTAVTPKKGRAVGMKKIPKR